MHTIDLLRGQGIPAKATLGSIAMIIVIIAVPILTAAAMVDRYFQNQTDIGIKQQAISKEQATIEEFADAVKIKEAILKQQSDMQSKLSEVSSCLGKYIQWTPVLETIARYMPTEMVMNELRVENTTERQKVKSEKDPNRTVNVTVLKRTLVLDISGTEFRDYGSEVQNYSRRLKSSAELGPKLENIEFAQKPGNTGEMNTVSYTMNIKFKSGAL